ncbi:hypothetical protein PYCC9005_003838 [Savitreella phatthalungensis]
MSLEIDQDANRHTDPDFHKLSRFQRWQTQYEITLGIYLLDPAERIVVQAIFALVVVMATWCCWRGVMIGLQWMPALERVWSKGYGVKLDWHGGRWGNGANASMEAIAAAAAGPLRDAIEMQIPVPMPAPFAGYFGDAATKQELTSNLQTL